ncbi:trehalose-phosphatase [Streptomyces roseirectus]|uniref:Trehalose 6-phosphate phosphatase n=1 Tax=Streptomyces roseirectus TaxID=2768066 RepID=A0A7H0IGN1_9ACTN|nr:trehalose-phosphatase [Streptomyces roseirectus]QNP71947.1 trehalose-phosphatase [Streptomyces roseirectus]
MGTHLTPTARTALDAIRTHPSRSLLAFDFDGTLAPIVENPENSRPYPGAVDALKVLADRGARIAVITGRPAEVAVKYGEFEDVTGMTVLGHYGAERWDQGTGQITAPPPPPALDDVRRELPGVLGEADAWVEEKGRAVAVHTRRAKNPQALWEALNPPITDLATRHGLIVEPGRLVLEIRPAGMDKGAALTTLAEETGAEAILYAGDDLGDIPAFDAVTTLRETTGTPGLLICSGSKEVTALTTRADLTVDGPAGVVRLLNQLVNELS